MKLKLAEIAEIMTGHTYRGRVIHDSSGDTRLVQSKDVTWDRTVNAEKLPKVHIGETRSKAYLKTGDVLLSSRGTFRAGLWLKDVQDVLATSTVYVIRLTDKRVNPEFLAIFINSNYGQQEIQKYVRTATIPALPKAGVMELEIPVLSHELQQLAVSVQETQQAISSLRAKQGRLAKIIADAALSNLLTQ